MLSQDAESQQCDSSVDSQSQSIEGSDSDDEDFRAEAFKALESEVQTILTSPSLDEGKLNKLSAKQDLTKLRNSPLPYWRDYAQSLQVLRVGIPAVKFNYSNDKSKQVLLQCSADGKTLMYSDPNAKRSVFKKAFGIGMKKRALSDYQGLVFGGATSTFARHKEALLKKLEDYKPYHRSNLAQSGKLNELV